MDSVDNRVVSLKPISRGSQSTDPFFVHTGKREAEQAFPHFLDDVRFSNVVIGWRDKHNRPGITLVDKANRKVGAIVCSTETIRDLAVTIIINHLNLTEGE